MGIFNRGKKAGSTDPDLHDTEVGADRADRADDVEDVEVVADPVSVAGGDAGFSRARGPFDASEVDPDDTRIDLGSLQLPPQPNMQLRLELDQEQQNVVSAHAILGDSGVQLQVFAAPRGEGLWADIRSEIAQSIVAQGGTSEEVSGPLGVELAAAIPSRGADGRTVRQEVRFLGVDGPRWFLRGVISGPAARHQQVAAPLVELMRSVVVVRDAEARPPREALPLRVPEADPAPKEDAATVDVAGDADDSAAAPARSADDLRPFERGPEITEVR